MAHAVGKRVGLARAGARDDQERAAIRCIASVLDGATLPGVEGVEIVVLGGRIVPRRRGGIVLFAKHGAVGQADRRDATPRARDLRLRQQPLRGVRAGDNQGADAARNCRQNIAVRAEAPAAYGLHVTITPKEAA